jgi:hypothetical protein
MLKDKHITAINIILDDLTDPKDVRELYPIIKRRLEYLRRIDSLKYIPGQKVEFIHNNVPISGIIGRVNQKTVTLKDCSDGNTRGWRVPFSHIDRIL